MNHTFRLLRMIAGLLFIGFLAGCAGAGADPASPGNGGDGTGTTTRHTVEYRASWTGTSPGSNIVYTNATGATASLTLDSLSSPWSITIEDFPSTIPAGVTGSVLGSATIRTRVLVDGIERDVTEGNIATAGYDFLPVGSVTNHSVQYRVDWHDEPGSILYTNTTGGRISIADASSQPDPYEISYSSFPSDADPAITATAPSGSTVTVSITVDGVQVASQTGSIATVAHLLR